jgi:hypothetical protein
MGGIYARLAGQAPQRAVEAGRVAGREQLFRVGPGATGAVQLGRHREVEIETVVRGQDMAGAAIPRGYDLRGVQDLIGHGQNPIDRD